jgi:hypothetical protein
VSAVHAAGEWPAVRQLVGLTTTPILRPNGDIVTHPGFDTQSGMFYAPEGTVSSAHDPPRPTRGDAARAVNELFEAVADFPFADDAHRAGWLAALLTPLARHLTPCVPGFLIDATTPGTGKTLLADVIGLVVNGRGMPRTPWTKEDDEVRKRLLAHALAGDGAVLIDNVPAATAVGWPSLDMALTAPEIMDRVLSESRRVVAPNMLTLIVTGNNLSLRGDTARRMLRIRLESADEHPEDRSIFAHPDLRTWVTSERSRLLGAALTILAAYLRAECPAPKPRAPLGSFEVWDRIVRGALLWLDLPDPVQLLGARDPDADPDATAHRALLELLWERFHEGITAGEIATRIKPDKDGTPPDPDLAEAISELVSPRRGGSPSARDIGYALRRLRGRRRRLDEDTIAWIDRDNRDHKTSRWKVKTLLKGAMG